MTVTFTLPEFGQTEMIIEPKPMTGQYSINAVWRCFEARAFDFDLEQAKREAFANLITRITGWADGGQFVR